MNVRNQQRNRINLHQLAQVASGATQAMAHAITKGVATTRTRSVVSLVELTRGVLVGFVVAETTPNQNTPRFTLRDAGELV